MLKVLFFSTLFLLIGSSLTYANIYKCQPPNGTILYTSDPALVPAECQIERVTDLPLLGIIQEPSLRHVPTPSSYIADISTKNDDGEGSFMFLKGEAETLVAKFRSTRRRISHSMGSSKWEARQELIEIRAQKKKLLSETDRLPFSYSEKEEIQAMLTSITQ